MTPRCLFIPQEQCDYLVSAIGWSVAGLILGILVGILLCNALDHPTRRSKR